MPDQTEIEKENKELRKEVENLNSRLQQLTRHTTELAETLDKRTAGINTAGYQHARYFATIQGLINFVKSMNQMINAIQMTQAELQGQLIAVLKLTQPYFNQDIEQIVNQVVNAQNMQSQDQLNHSKHQQ